MAVDRPLDEDIYSLLQRQYVGGGTPVGAPAAAPAQAVLPTQQSVQQPAPALGMAQQMGSQVSGDPMSLGVFAERFQNELAQLGWTGGSPVVYDIDMGAGESGQEARYVPVGVNPEFQQFLAGKNLQVALNPTAGGFQVSLLSNGQPIGQYTENKNSFERFMDVFQPIAVNMILAAAVAGPISAAISAVVPGISAATAATAAKAIAPTVVQAASTGQVDLNSAVRNVVGTFVGQSLGSQAANAANQAYLQSTGNPLPPAALQAVSNAAASAAATAMQQGADLSDVGRNALAGSVSAAVGDTLRQQGIDPNIAAGTGRAVGSYVSSGSGVQAIVSGLTRGLTYEEPQQRPAPVEERVGTPVPPERETAPPAPPPAPEPVAEAPAPAEPTGPQTIEVTGQRPTGPTPDFISTPTAGEPRAPAPPPPRQQQGVTVSPTDVFSLIKRSGQGPQSLSRITSMAYPMGRTMGTGAFSPAGEVDAGGSYQARQPVWNEASLRLKDALGL